VHYRAQGWVNGREAGAHEGCHLPFQFAVEGLVKFGAMNRIVIAVNGELTKHTVPPGHKHDGNLIMGLYSDASKPDVSFDFFPFSGIHRPVVLYTTSPDHIADLTVTTDIRGTSGIVRLAVEREGHDADRMTVGLAGQTREVKLNGRTGLAEIIVPKAKLWCPENPHLYDLTVRLYRGTQLTDEYTLPIGIRTIKVTGRQLLLNGKPVHLQGFGKHEDFHVIGRGLNLAVLKKDFELLKWIGANSFRTSHYPYAEEVMDMADRTGIMVIDETPAVGLSFDYDMQLAQANHSQTITELIARDKNHPCVVMWSLANEPNSQDPKSVAYFTPLVKQARKLDPTRPLTIVSCNGAWARHKKCNILGLCDVIVINRYYGWYVGHGQFPEVIQGLDKELDEIYREYKRPIMMGEFGADCVAGLHCLPATIWSEEYQAKLLEDTINVVRSKKFMCGEHIWNFADFMTGQTHTRAVGNKKGVFTRERQPKLAAHVVRRLWQEGKR
jgi:beta-glucuronidase